MGNLDLRVDFARNHACNRCIYGVLNIRRNVTMERAETCGFRRLETKLISFRRKFAIFDIGQHSRHSTREVKNSRLQNGVRPVFDRIVVDLSPKFPPALGGVLGVKSLALSRHLVHCLSLQKFHRCQVAQC